MLVLYYRRPLFHLHGVQEPSKIQERTPRHRRVPAGPKTRATRGVQHPLGDLDATMGRLVLKCAVAGDKPRPAPSTVHDDAQAVPGVPRVVDRQYLAIGGSLSTRSSTRNDRIRGSATI